MCLVSSSVCKFYEIFNDIFGEILTVRRFHEAVHAYLQVAVQFVAQSSAELRVIAIDLMHSLNSTHDQHVYRVVERRHLCTVRDTTLITTHIMHHNRSIELFRHNFTGGGGKNPKFGLDIQPQSS